MPLCRPLLRSLLHSRALRPCRCPPSDWATCPCAQVRLYQSSTACRESRQDESTSVKKLDLSTISADSAYLDFILGSKRDASTPQLDAKAVLHDESIRAQKKVAGGLSQRRSSGLRESKAKSGDSSKRRTSGRKTVQQSRLKLGKLPARHAKSRSHTSKTAWRANVKFHQLRAEGIRLRSKFVSVRSGTSPSDRFSRNWNANFARIQTIFDGPSSGGRVEEPMPPILHPQTIDWVQQVLDHLEHSNEPFQACEVLHKDPKRAISRWQCVALWLLYYEPKRMLDLLRLVKTSPQPPLSCLEDSLQYLASHFSRCSSSEQADVWQKLLDAFLDIVHHRSDKRLWMSSSFFRLLMHHCTDDQIVHMYDAIQRRQVHVSWHTLLHFATHFARHNHFEQSLSAVLRANSAGAALDSYAFRSTCATLLRTAIRQPRGLRVTLRIVSNLVKIGLPLNTRLCNIVILNAVEAGDLKTAFSVYHSLVEHGLQADVYTHTILLKGCKANIDDADTLNTTIRNAIAGANVLRHSVLATEILQCLALHHTKHNPDRAYETVFDAYAQLFHLRPLEKLGVAPAKALQTSRPAEEKLQPSPHAINIMLTAYLEHHFIRNRSTAPVHDLYQRLRALVEAGEEPFVQLVKTDHTANLFLASFTRTRKGLLYAAEVIKDMQKGLPGDAKVPQCKPSVQSWSIFLHGFTRHGQLQLAEQVLSFMRAQGLQPNHVTWTSLIAGYARAQEVDRALDAVRRGEADGAVWDDWSLSGLKRLGDRRKLHDEWQRQKLATSLDFTEELRDGLGARISALPTDAEPEAKSHARTAQEAISGSPAL